jgi:hypothetical protein
MVAGGITNGSLAAAWPEFAPDMPSATTAHPATAASAAQDDRTRTAPMVTL